MKIGHTVDRSILVTTATLKQMSQKSILYIRSELFLISIAHWFGVYYVTLHSAHRIQVYSS
jgi:hypothetical protein